MKKSFEIVAREWWSKFVNGKMVTDRTIWERLEREALPDLGALTLAKIDARRILTVLQRVESRGAVETAHKLKCSISQILRYGIACGLILSNPARDLSWALAPQRHRPRAALIEPGQVGRLMHKIETMPRGVTRSALKMAALTFVRPGELRRAEWIEVDMDGAEWRIPAARMKMRRPHIVPLARQAVEVLRGLRSITGDSVYVFPQARDQGKPTCAKRINYALRRLGFGAAEMCGHGFRAMASSLLSEQGWSVDAIERQLAHVEGNQVRAAYHRSGHLEERRRMMQSWADYLDMRCAFAVLGR
jgi:integrase